MARLIIPGSPREHRAYNRIIEGLAEAKAGAEQLAYYRPDQRDLWAEVAVKLEATANLIYELELNNQQRGA